MEDEKIKVKIVRIFSKYATIWEDRLGRMEATEYRIDLKENENPVHQIQYRQGFAVSDKTEEVVKDQLKARVIGPATSEWEIPVVFFPKLDDRRRCFDSKLLAQVNIVDTYPLPRTDGYIDSLGDAMFFSMLDYNYGYWKILI